MKPNVFIGSSQANLLVVRELERALHQNCEVIPWDSEGLFSAGDILLDRLLELSGTYDFAILVFGFDDFLVGGDVAVPRDNVLFELGLFMSRLGRYRTFVVLPQMEGKRVKILSDLGGLISLRYDVPPSHEQLRIFLAPVVQQLLVRIGSLSSPKAVETTDFAHPDVHGLLESLRKVIAERMAKSHRVKITNLALDMETTWGYLRDSYLKKTENSGFIWRSLMIDPNSPAIRALKSDSVSTTTAARRISEIQTFLLEHQVEMGDRGLHVQVRAYASIPVMHGFLVDHDLLFLSFCGIQQVVSPKYPGRVVNELIGSPTAYWQFDSNSTNTASRYFVSAFASWFEFLWKNSRSIWPASITKGRR